MSAVSLAQLTMTLREWMDAHNHSAAWVAGQIKASEAAVSKWLNNKSLPSLKMVNRVHRLTGGEVTSLDWETEEEGQER